MPKVIHAKTRVTVRNMWGSSQRKGKKIPGVLEGNSPPTDWHGVVIISGASAPSLPQFLSRRGSSRPPVVKDITYHPVRPCRRGCITFCHSAQSSHSLPITQVQPTSLLHGEAQWCTVRIARPLNFFTPSTCWSDTLCSLQCRKSWPLFPLKVAPLIWRFNSVNATMFSFKAMPTMPQ